MTPKLIENKIEVGLLGGTDGRQSRGVAGQVLAHTLPSKEPLLATSIYRTQSSLRSTPKKSLKPNTYSPKKKNKPPTGRMHTYEDKQIRSGLGGGHSAKKNAISSKSLPKDVVDFTDTVTRIGKRTSSTHYDRNQENPDGKYFARDTFGNSTKRNTSAEKKKKISITPKASVKPNQDVLLKGLRQSAAQIVKMSREKANASTNKFKGTSGRLSGSNTARSTGSAKKNQQEELSPTFKS